MTGAGVRRFASRPWILAVTAALAAAGALIVRGLVTGRTESAVEQQRDAPVDAPSRVSARGGEAVVAVSAAAQDRSGIVTAEVPSVTAHASLRAYGEVLGAESLAAARSAYASAQADVGRSRAELAASEREYKRLEALYREKNVSAEALQAQEAAYRSDQASLDAAQVAVAAAATAAMERFGPVVGGWITNDGGELDRLLGGQDVLVQLTLPPDESVAEPPATALLRSNGEARGAARLVSRAVRTDPQIQGQSFVYLAASRPDLIPGMSVVALLPAGPQVMGAYVPQSAVVWLQGSAWVYVQTAPGEFVRRKISTDLPSDGGYLARSIPEGSRVVIEGAQMLLSEEFRAEIQVGSEAERP